MALRRQGASLYLREFAGQLAMVRLSSYRVVWLRQPRSTSAACVVLPIAPVLLRASQPDSCGQAMYDDCCMPHERAGIVGRLIVGCQSAREHCPSTTSCLSAALACRSG